MPHGHAKPRRRVLATHSVIVVTLLASSAITFNQGQTTLYMQPQGPVTLRPGEATELDVMLASRVPVNAMSATLAFPPDLLTVVSVSKEHSFLDLWTEETAIREETGEVHWSGGTFKKGGITGSTTALTLRVRALKPGQARIYFKEAEVLASDGSGTPVETVDTPFTYEIRQPVAGGGGSAAAPKAQTMDFDGNGRLDFADVSIFLYHLQEPYDRSYDLNVDGVLSVADLSILLAAMH